MRHELVHRLTQLGHRRPTVPFPGRPLAGRAGVLTRTIVLTAALTVALATTLIAVQLATIAVLTALAVPPVATWATVLLATAAAPTAATRLLARGLGGGPRA